MSRPMMSAIRPSAFAPAASRLFPANTSRCGTRCCSWTACRRFTFRFTARTLGERVNNFNFLPGYRSAYGPYVMSTYTWFLERGGGRPVAPGLSGEARGRLGAGIEPAPGPLGRGRVQVLLRARPGSGPEHQQPAAFGNIPENRQCVLLRLGRRRPFTNLNVKAQVNYQSDPLVLHDFFQGAYTGNPQPNTFIEVNKYWDNWEPRRRNHAAASIISSTRSNGCRT